MGFLPLFVMLLFFFASSIIKTIECNSRRKGLYEVIIIVIMVQRTVGLKARFDSISSYKFVNHLPSLFSFPNLCNGKNTPLPIWWICGEGHRLCQTRRLWCALFIVKPHVPTYIISYKITYQSAFMESHNFANISQSFSQGMVTVPGII